MYKKESPDTTSFAVHSQGLFALSLQWNMQMVQIQSHGNKIANTKYNSHLLIVRI